MIDLQECPMMDLAVAEVLVAVAKALVEGRLGDPEAFRTCRKRNCSRCSLG